MQHVAEINMGVVVAIVDFQTILGNLLDGEPYRLIDLNIYSVIIHIKHDS